MLRTLVNGGLLAAPCASDPKCGGLCSADQCRGGNRFGCAARGRSNVQPIDLVARTHGAAL